MIVTDASYPRVYFDAAGPLYLVATPDRPAAYIQLNTRELRPTRVLVDRELRRYTWLPLTSMDWAFRVRCAKYLQGDQT